MPFDHSLVYIVDDDSAIRGGIKRLVESIGLSARSFSNANDFFADYDASVVGCLVLDIRMPEISGMKLQALLIERNIMVPIIFITGHADVPTAVDALKKGAFDFQEKPFNERHLLDRIQEALAKDLRDREVRAMRDEVTKRYQTLSDREKQVLKLVLVGKPNKMIARDMDLGQSTIELHRANVMRKMEAGSLPELVSMVNVIDPMH